MSDWNADVLRHKYDPLPEEPRRRKKAKKVHIRSDHKHEYEQVCVDAHSYTITRDGRFYTYEIVTRCKVCGRVKDVDSSHYLREPPEDMPLYEVENVIELWRMKYLTEDKRIS